MEITAYCKEQVDNRLLPYPLRSLIVGASGCGKTNLLLNFIYNKNGLVFNHLYVFSRSIEQPAYLELRKIYENLEKKLGVAVGHFYSNCEDLVSVDECKSDSLVVFDDCLLEEQTKIKEYFIRGRHKRISCIYLSQSYGRVDMQVVRNNVNLLCVFRQNKHYTKRIFEDIVGSDMSYEEFARLCKSCWDEPFGFISIDVNRKVHEAKYRCKLNDILNPVNEN